MSEFHAHQYNFPISDEYIAQHPAEKRDASWLMALDHKTQKREHTVFSKIGDYLEPEDLLVFNDTKVIPARLLGQKKGAGGHAEVLLLQDLGNDRWEALARPGRRLGVGTEIIFDEQFSCVVEADTDFGGKIIKFNYCGDFYEQLDRLGFIPLPPYIKKYEHVSTKHTLAERYQTVYAAERGAAAAPTAGLHFTPELLDELKTKGVQTAFVTLHTGLGTFRPIATEDVREHDIHEEWYRLPAEVVAQIRATIKAGKRVIAVGTTVVRVLETEKTFIVGDDSPTAREGFTKIYIYPGYTFGVVDALITNFHLPMSTLLVLVAAFAGKEFILDSYLEALKKKYRFYSFGDAMFVY